MYNPALQELERLPKDTLIELIKMYSHNWMTLDGLWFSGVEEKYGLDAALELDVRMWQIGSAIEAKRIKNVLDLEEGGLDTIMKTINFMTWAPRFGYEYTISGNKAIWTCKHCPPQEQRVAMDKGEFSCQPTFGACFNNVVKVIDPRTCYMYILSS